MKPNLTDQINSEARVAPRAGAWIETLPINPVLRPPQSPPARGRGLKLGLITGSDTGLASPPARGRGLKPMPAARAESLVSRPPRGGVD